MCMISNWKLLSKNKLLGGEQRELDGSLSPPISTRVQEVEPLGVMTRKIFKTCYNNFEVVYLQRF